MVGVLSAQIQGNAGGFQFTCQVTVAAADAPTAQTDLNAIKAFFVNGGATVSSCTGTFTPQSTGLTA